MKCKVILIIALMLISSMGVTQNDMPNGTEQIKLRGSLDLNAGPNSVEAGQDDIAVYVYFHQNFGNVSVSLYNEAGCLVYSTVVDTSVQQTLVIPISWAPCGMYYLELNNAFGNAEGEFLRN